MFGKRSRRGPVRRGGLVPGPSRLDSIGHRFRRQDLGEGREQEVVLGGGPDAESEVAVGRDLLAGVELMIMELHDLPLARVIGALSERQRQRMAPMVIELRRLLTEIERRLNR